MTKTKKLGAKALSLYEDLMLFWKQELLKMIPELVNIKQNEYPLEYFGIKARVDQIILKLRYLTLEINSVEEIMRQMKKGIYPPKLPRHDFEEMMSVEEKMTFQLASELQIDPNLILREEVLKYNTVSFVKKVVQTGDLFSLDENFELVKDPSSFCIICFGMIKEEEIKSSCSNCDYSAHDNHMKMWRINHSNCPVCKFEWVNEL